MLMADFRHRHAENVPGKFYVDVLCLDCTVCREIAPTIFYRDDERDIVYIFNQPSTPEEIAMCEECVKRCPCEAVGNDGDRHDWAVPPEPSTLAPVGERPPKQCPVPKAKWKFW